MKNFQDFTQEFGNYFNLPDYIFEIDLENQKIQYEDVDITYFSIQELRYNQVFSAYSYKRNNRENWISISLYSTRFNSGNIIQFIKNYHEGELTVEESKQIENVLESGNGNFAIGNNAGDLNYLVFECNNNDCFIDIAKRNE